MAGFGPVGSTPVASIGSSTPSTNFTPGAGAIVYQGYAPSSGYSVPTIQTGWYGLEVLHIGVSNVQVGWHGLEVTHVGDAYIQIGWTGLEVTHVGDAYIQMGWFGIEVLRTVASRETDYPKTMMIL